MGVFDIVDELKQLADGSMEKMLSSALREAEENQKRPSVTSLNFVPVPPGKAEELKGVKVGLFGRGDKKKLIASIEAGKTTYAEVLVLARMNRIVDRSEDSRNNTYMYFYKMADLQGNVLREDAPVMDDAFAVTFAYREGDSASETDCADVVDPDNYEHMILLHYYLGDDQYYVLLSKSQFEDIGLLAKYAGCRFHFVEDGVGYDW